MTSWASEEDWVGVGAYGPEGQLDWFKYTGATQPAVGDVIRVYAIPTQDIPDMPREMVVQVTRVDEVRIMARRLDVLVREYPDPPRLDPGAGGIDVVS